jgi:hypothetical protein
VKSASADLRLIAVLAAAGAAIAGCGGAMKQSELADSLDTVESSAAEAALLATQAADDRTKTTFVRVRAREISETLDHEGEKLSDAEAGADVSADRERALDLIERIGAALDDLRTAPDDRAAADAAAEELTRLADATASLQEHL